MRPAFKPGDVVRVLPSSYSNDGCDSFSGTWTVCGVASDGDIVLLPGALEVFEVVDRTDWELSITPRRCELTRASSAEYAAAVCLADYAYFHGPRHDRERQVWP